MHRKRPTPFADYVLIGMALALRDWAMEQALLRAAALREHGASGGGIPPMVVYHCPEAIR